MSISYKITKEDNIVEITIAGKVSNDEVVTEIRRLMESGEYVPGMDGIIDARESDTDASTDEIRQLAAAMAEYKHLTRNSRRAIVASEDLIYGISRMYESYSVSNYADVKLFRDIDQARAWLKKPGDTNDG